MKSSHPTTGEKHYITQRVTSGESVCQFVSFSDLPSQSEGDMTQHTSNYTAAVRTIKMSMLSVPGTRNRNSQTAMRLILHETQTEN